MLLIAVFLRKLFFEYYLAFEKQESFPFAPVVDLTALRSVGNCRLTE